VSCTSRREVHTTAAWQQEQAVAASFSPAHAVGLGEPAVAEAVPQRGDLRGVRAAQDAPQAPRAPGLATVRLKQPVHAGAEEARRREPEVVREPGDGVGEQTVDQEQSDEDPLQRRVRQRGRDPVRGRQLPRHHRRRHGFRALLNDYGCSMGNSDRAWSLRARTGSKGSCCRRARGKRVDERLQGQMG
jgi:hypothetical protein